MMADCNVDSFLNFADLTASVTYASGPRVHLETKLNLAFLDGHVKLLQEGDDDTLFHVDGVSQASPSGAPTGW